MRRILFTLISLFLFGQTLVMAQEWKIDQAHSSIMFEIKHIYSITRGHFSDFTGNISFDLDHPEKSRCEFAVKVDSINTSDGKRDNHLRSGDFFDSKKYPEMVFKSTRISHINGNKYLLEGKMTLKDVTRDMQMEVIYLGKKENPFDKKKMVAGFETRIKFNRLDFNVGNGQFYKMGVVGKEVDLLISLEMVSDK